MKSSRSLALILASLLASGTLSACGGEGTTSDTTAASADTTPEVTTSEFTPANIDLGGKDITMLLWSDTLMAVEEETGDVIDDAVFKRNSTIEDLYNFNFKFDVRDCPHGPSGHQAWFSVLQASILAGDNAYQFGGGYSYQLVTSSLSGQFYNLNDNPNIDFSKPWWPSNIMEAGNIGGNMYLTYGNMDPLYYDFTYAIFFNKRIAQDVNISDPYAMVKDGSWTLDKVIELSALAASDLNGDTKIDDNDRYGYITDWNMSTDSYIQACEIPITKTGSNGMPELVGLSERYVNVYEKLKSFFKESGNVKYGANNDNQFVNMFMNGQGLFYADKLGNAHILREMKDDFGILPYPKWDAAQEGYHTYNAIGDTTGFLIPVTADEAACGAILEAMAYYGWKDILPEYFERALKGKAARDSESAEMLELIFDNIEFDFTQIYSSSFGDQKAPSMVLRMTLKNDKEISSLWASDENNYAETMKKLIETLE